MGCVRRFFATVKQVSGLHVVGVPRNDVRHLTTAEVDIILVDASTAFLAHMRDGHTLVAVEELKDGTQAYRSIAVVRANSNIGSFADFKGRRSCHGSFLDPVGMVLPHSWATQEGAALGLELEAGISTNSTSYSPIEACDNPTSAVMRGFFGASCAPSNEAGQVGICDLCAQAGKGSCDSSDDYAGDIGALRGVSEMACEVAFVRNTTWQRACGSSSSRPGWCVDHSELRQVGPSFGDSPSVGFLIRKGSLSPGALADVRRMLVALNHQPEVLRLLGIDGVAPGPEGASFGSDEYTLAHLQPLRSALHDLPGYAVSMACEHIEHLLDSSSPAASPFALLMDGTVTEEQLSACLAWRGVSCNNYKYADKRRWAVPIAPSSPGRRPVTQPV